jgi:hypothetical protein
LLKYKKGSISPPIAIADICTLLPKASQRLSGKLASIKAHKVDGGLWIKRDASGGMTGAFRTPSFAISARCAPRETSTNDIKLLTAGKCHWTGATALATTAGFVVIT